MGLRKSNYEKRRADYAHQCHEALRRTPGARWCQSNRERGRDGGDHRSERRRQIDAPALSERLEYFRCGRDPHRRAAPEAGGRPANERRRRGAGAALAGDGVSRFSAVPAFDSFAKRHRSPAQCLEDRQGGGRGTRLAVVEARWFGRSGGRLSQPALRRPKAARRNRPRPGHGAARLAV